MHLIVKNVKYFHFIQCYNEFKKKKNSKAPELEINKTKQIYI